MPYPFLLIAEWMMSESCEHPCDLLLAENKKQAKEVSILVGKPLIERFVATLVLEKTWHNYELLKRIAEAGEGDELYDTKLLLCHVASVAYEQGLKGKPSRPSGT